MNIDAAFSKPIVDAPEDILPAAELPPRVGRSILTVQGCSGCRRPSVARIKTPFGTRKIYNRLKMTRIPGMVDVLPRQASGTVVRTRPVYAPLCKTCRKEAQ